MNAPATLTAHTAIFWCPSCEAMVHADSQGLCAGCDSIIDMTLWQETEEAWASDARAMECAEPEDPFFAPNRALERGYL
jgi:hypothetical protein